MRFTCNTIAIRLPHIINDSPLQLAQFKDNLVIVVAELQGGEAWGR
jgi:hypothetical protein